MVNYLEGTDYLIRKFKKAQMIEDVIYYNSQTGNVEKVLRLTAHGRKEAERYGYFDSYFSQSVEHDYQLSTYYLTLSKNQRDTWITEKKLAKLLPQTIEVGKTTDFFFSNKFCSAVDGAYYKDDTTLVGVEIETKYYTEEMKSQKREFAVAFDMFLIEIGGAKKHD